MCVCVCVCVFKTGAWFKKGRCARLTHGIPYVKEALAPDGVFGHVQRPQPTRQRERVHGVNVTHVHHAPAWCQRRSVASVWVPRQRDAAVRRKHCQAGRQQRPSDGPKGTPSSTPRRRRRLARSPTSRLVRVGRAQGGYAGCAGCECGWCRPADCATRCRHRRGVGASGNRSPHHSIEPRRHSTRRRTVGR